MAEMKKKILLFGRTGSGKSTVANMLIKGHVNPPLMFQTSSGVRGQTISFQREENEDLVVVDTVGFGEGEHGRVSDAEAKNKLYDFFVKLNEENFNYIGYVHKWGKLDELDARLWDFFKQAFAGGECNFVVIFTHCPRPKDLEQNMADVRSFFSGCHRYIPVDFPVAAKSKDTGDLKSKRTEMVRRTSLKRLSESFEGMILPAILCMRSNLKKGRVLVMGPSRTARNMVAKLLVDGHTSVPTTTTTDFDGIVDFEETEGRGWQVVNAVALDREFLVNIYQGITSEVDEKIQDIVESRFGKSLATKFFRYIDHGTYSHYVYVEDYGNTLEEDKSMIQAITSLLLRHDGGSLESCVAVLVNCEQIGAASKKLVPEEFKEWSKVCEIQLPPCCETLCIEQQNLEEIHRQGLRVLEGVLYAATSDNIGRRYFPRKQYDWSDINGEAFHPLVPTFRSHSTGNKDILNVLAGKFKALNFVKDEHLELEDCSINYALVNAM